MSTADSESGLPSDNTVAGPAAVAAGTRCREGCTRCRQGRTPYHWCRWPVSDLFSSSSSRLLKVTRCSVLAGLFSGQGASLDGSSGAVGSGSTHGGDGTLGVSPWGRAVYGASPGAATLPVLCIPNIGVLEHAICLGYAGHSVPNCTLRDHRLFAILRCLSARRSHDGLLCVDGTPLIAADGAIRSPSSSTPIQS